MSAIPVKFCTNLVSDNKRRAIVRRNVDDTVRCISLARINNADFAPVWRLEKPGVTWLATT